MPTVRRTGAGRTFSSLEDNRVRQFDGTLKRLAADDVRLVELPNAHKPKAKYEGFILLDEVGDPERASSVRYRVPRSGEAVFGLPPAFFLNGWHMVLSDSELALLLSVLAHAGRAEAWPSELTVQLDGATRIRFHGLSLDTYAAHRYLAAFGLLEVVPDPNRRPDGTVEGQQEGVRLIPHQLRVVEAGFEKKAQSVVMGQLQGMRTTKL